MLSSPRLHYVAFCMFLLAIATLRPVLASDPNHEATLRSTGSCAGCDLRGADLSGVVATGGDLTNADLANAVLYMATLKDADLTGAALNGADLSGAILTGARGANFEDAITDSRTTCPNGTQGPCQ